MFVAESEVNEVAKRTYHCSGFSDVTAFETAEGLLLVDTGLADESEVFADLLRQHTDAPVHTAIYTHGHLDHAFGLDAYLLDGQDDPEVIAHQAMPARFDRYKQTVGHNEAINNRQFGGTASARNDEVDESRFGWPEHPPTTLYRDDLTVEVGDVTFEIHHGKGETDDHSWLYCPDRDVLCTGDFFISVAPNAGNPQKVQRYPWAWADTLEEMAGKNAATLCPGHGAPIVDDASEIRRRLLSGAEYLDTIVEQALDALNDGSPPHVDIVHEVDLPNPEEPWLDEVYDNGEFIVRNVLRYYGGWWSGRPSELKPATREGLAEELTNLIGDAEQVAIRASNLAEAGDHRLAGHLADFALESAPDNDVVQANVTEVYEQRAETETDLMAQNIYSAAAEYATEGRRFR
ncbi:alkyl sulfatase dimerization domain-containing protein [Natrinema sp. CGMCC1.2065]|uniref:alkyl sulfatase dimerization domain-containing protein n=1 Tax=Natrinema sp. CGMCC1.2065 TaxID=3445767 RepID=UPI003F49F3E5